MSARRRNRGGAGRIGRRHQGQRFALHRLAICAELAIPYDTKAINAIESRDGAKLWIIYNQLGRRNITEFQRGELVLAAKPLIAAEAKARQGTRTDLGNIVQNSAQGAPEENKTRVKLAKLSGVSHDTAYRSGKLGACWGLMKRPSTVIPQPLQMQQAIKTELEKTKS